ncbi:nucleoside-diphosphate sugar epimerase/dehydratase [Luteimonas sp. YGD11-2]|uniref:polysaccharide biosynthesis protein n=1 Tax=Luteimonas sp. YGD11-2 TaxID=2508168 RepID=UPI00100B2A47|nr:nucleoside-diphosphate sugar epimerase/dehydratase [Luteimonas sp. YGD11-2]
MISWHERAGAWLPRAGIIAHDLFMVWLCWIVLHQFRLSMQPVPMETPLWSTATLIVVAAQGLVLWRVGLYRGVWRFASVPDLVNILKASVFGLLAILIALFLYNRLELVPRTVLVLYPVALTALLGMPRLLYRSWKDHSLARTDQSAVRVLILGAGQAGEALLRDLRRTGAYQAVGFLDDAAKLRGSYLQGVPVLGRVEDVARIAPETAARLLIIAMPSLDAANMRRVVALCEETGLPFRTVPRLDDLLEGQSLPGELKEVAIEDLLGRQPVLPDWQAIRSWLGGRSVLVTGGGGSIGAELCRQCARNGARQITVVDVDELALATIQARLGRDFPHIECLPVLGDCGDPAVMRHALSLSTPEAVFHAAAYKQVPVLEGQLREAVRNNVLATETVAREASAAGVGSFVLISTDKAVDPANVLGATKRLAETVCQSLAESTQTRFVTVRFGNVLDSAGSVVPLFREQIRTGGPVTVTDPDVTRYFMTIPEACLLILQAAAIGSRHAVYTLDMGEPVSIRLLAEQMIRLAGKHPQRDIAIVYTGLRPGEKLHETLFHADERYRPTSHPKILQAEARAVRSEDVLAATQRLRHASERYDLAELAVTLRASVPEFIPANIPDTHKSRTVVEFPARHARRT